MPQDDKPREMEKKIFTKTLIFRCLTTKRICTNFHIQYTKDFIRADGGDFYNRRTGEMAEILREF